MLRDPRKRAWACQYYPRFPIVRFASFRAVLSSSWVNVFSKQTILREKLPGKVEVAAGIAEEVETGKR